MNGLTDDQPEAIPPVAQVTLTDVGQNFRYVAWGFAALMAWLVFSEAKKVR